MPHIATSQPMTWRRRISSFDIVDAPTKMFSPKYSDGSFERMPFISAAIFFVVWPPPRYWSHFHFMSATQ